MNAARIHEHGGIDVLRYETVSNPEPESNEVLIQIKA